ncbi:LolA family protein [Serinibacter salmoneus]|uniref:Outer membrane lipoprotein-sorting protein n=1 Tax=Serinibacter salmoneus TaxID=556530 RepID=A0A2A9CWB1_9MICO|nr:hypothetical protein [Serinibacter salmoneus]PFG18717.1 hypothetical protein ATL40_0260 [Serinibacter salmoneus]
MNATARTRARWAVPGAVALAVAAAVAVPTLASADAGDLPETTPTDLLADVAAAEPFALSGTAVYTARLGLPELTAEMTGGADPLNLLSGSSTIRVWTDGAERSRVALLGSASEYSVVMDGPQMWTYSSADNAVTHLSLDTESLAMSEEFAAQEAMPTGEVPTPTEFAEHLLAVAEENAQVTLGEDVRVAGRDAYQLLLTPTTPGTLLQEVSIAVDGETYLPLSVQVWSTQEPGAPALELAFTDLTYETPSDAALAFSAPAGAAVTEHALSADDLREQSMHQGEAPTLPGDLTNEATEGATLPEGVSVSGEGWAEIVRVEDVDLTALLSGDPEQVQAELADSPFADGRNGDLMEEFKGEGDGFGVDGNALFDQLTTPVEGGRLFSSTLLSALITDDGVLYVGSVPTQALLAEAGLA